METRDRLTPLGKIVASAKRIAADMQPRTTAKNLSKCFLSIQRHSNSEISNKSATSAITKDDRRRNHYVITMREAANDTSSILRIKANLIGVPYHCQVLCTQESTTIFLILLFLAVNIDWIGTYCIEKGP